MTRGRPKPQIVEQCIHANGETWQILYSEYSYIITYQGKPVGIRSIVPGLGTLRRKYKKLSYLNEGNAQSQVKSLNAVFNTEDFGYQRCPL